MRRSVGVALFAICVLGSSALVGTAHAQGGKLEAMAGAPVYKVGPKPSPPFVYVVFIQGVKITATVPEMDAKKNTETAAEASQRKAKLVVDAINADIDRAINAGLLPANTTKATVGTLPNTIPNLDKNGKALKGQPKNKPNPFAGYGTVKIDKGVTEVGGKKDGARDPSGEPGSAQAQPIPDDNNKGGTGIKGAMGGPGASKGSAVAFDPLVGATSVTFGVLTYQGMNAGCVGDLPPFTPCPGSFITTVFPKSGEDDEEVLSELASLFNASFESVGYTVTYDEALDLLSLDQILGPFEFLFYQNTDPGLDLVASIRFVPGPRPLWLLAALPAALLTRRLVGRRWRPSRPQ